MHIYRVFRTNTNFIGERNVDPSRILDLLPDIQLTILIGNYAQKYYLHQKSSVKLTDTVAHYKKYLPDYFPLVHPSPRNQIWMSKHPWFEAQVVPDLKKIIQQIIQSS